MYALNITNPIYCYRFGLMKQVDEWDTGGEKLVPRNMFVLLTEGAALFHTSDKVYHLKAGDILFLPAHTPYTTQVDGFCSYFYCHFSGQMEPYLFPDTAPLTSRSFDQELPPIECRHIQIPSFLSLAENFNRIHYCLINCNEYFARGTQIGHLLLNNEIFKILLLISEIAEQNQSKASPPSTVNKLVLYIKKNITKPLKLSTICSDCNLSPSHVVRIFKKYMGMTVTEYINAEKIYFACELIQSSHLNITEIAAYLGYSDVAYFNRRFKRIFGKSPSQMFPKNNQQ